MSDSISTPTPTPTYQSVLMAGLLAIQDALNRGDYERAFDCIEGYRDFLVPPVRSEIEAEWQLYNTSLQKICKVRGVDQLDTRSKQRFYSKMLVKMRLHPLLQAIINSLYKHKYLNREWSTLQGKDFSGMQGEDSDKDETEGEGE